MTAVEHEPTFDEIAERVDRAIERIDELGESDREVVTELQDAVAAFHREPLVTIVRRLRSDPRGRELLFELVDDPGVRALLSVHGIIRPDPITQATRVLEHVRPYLQSHGGDVELVGVEDGVALVRLHGACNGCSMSAQTLSTEVTDALVENVPSIERVEVAEDEPTVALIPVSAIGRRDGGWVKGPLIDEVADGAIERIDVGEESFIVVNDGQKLAAFRNLCAHQGRELDGGFVDDGEIVCPWHGFRFDTTYGDCVSAPGAQLQSLPLRLDDGHVWIRPESA
ncbi:MAG: NifU family protein [Actinomycetota bacterium]